MTARTRIVQRMRIVGLLCTGWLCGAAHAQFPDLIVDSISVTPPNPAVGQSVSVEIGIANIGNSLPLQTFRLSVWYDGGVYKCGNENAWLLITDTIPTGGEVRFYQFKVTYQSPGAKTFFAWVDSCLEIPEWGENNNTHARAIIVVDLGDLNCDGAFNGADVDPFFLALGNPAGYAGQFPNCDPLLGDMNHDGRLDGGDIDPFFACLGGNCP